MVVYVLSALFAGVMVLATPNAVFAQSSAPVPHWCQRDGYGLPALRDLQSAVEGELSERDRELNAAFTRARRAARAPEYVRVQVGGRYDRDGETRARLTQDFDGSGSPTRASLEDRNTSQDDLYVDLRLAAEWRLARTRWSDAETALRRERQQLSAQRQDAIDLLHQRWLELLRTLRVICAPDDAPAPIAPNASRTRAAAASATPNDRTDAELRLAVLAHQLDDLSGGFFTERWHLGPASFRDAERSPDASVYDIVGEGPDDEGDVNRPLGSRGGRVGAFFFDSEALESDDAPVSD